MTEPGRTAITLWLTCGHDASWGKDWVFKSSRPAPIVADTTRDRRTDLEVFAELGAGWYIRRAGSVP